MRLNWFSGIYPGASEMAQATDRILSALRKYGSIVAWTPRSLLPPARRRLPLVRSYQTEDLPWRKVNLADSSVYQMDLSDTCFRAVLPVLARHAGVVILHGAAVHEAFLTFCRRCDTAEAYSSAMRRFYGRTGRTLASLHWEHLLPEGVIFSQFSLFELLTDNALAIVVEHRPLVRVLSRLVRVPVCYARFPDVRHSEAQIGAVPPPPDREEHRRPQAARGAPFCASTLDDQSEQYARTLVGVIRAAEKQRGRLCALQMAERAASAMADPAFALARESLVARTSAALASLFDTPRTPRNSLDRGTDFE